MNLSVAAEYALDNQAVSYSSPMPTIDPDANGTVDITLLANAVTEGFRLDYTKADKKWTLDGTDSTPVVDEKDEAPAGTEWTMTVPGRITVKITQGTNEYEDTDKYKFSVFKSSATGGKKNDIGADPIDVFDGP